jgi:U6 snRNA-associated Sm-like protein LSm7
MSTPLKSERDAVVDFAKYCDQRVRVRIQGGREVQGFLKGYDKLDNLVLDESIEFLRGRIVISCYFLLLANFSFSDPKDLSQVTDKTRELGLIVIRGTQVALIAPSDEMEEIANPFGESEEEENPGLGQAADVK